MKFSLVALSLFAASVSARCRGPCPTATVTLNPLHTECPLIKCIPPPICPDPIVFSGMPCCCPTGKAEPTITVHACPSCTTTCPPPRTQWGTTEKCKPTPGPRR